MSVAVEEKSIREMLDVVERIESVSRTLPDSQQRSELNEAVRRLLPQIQPVRVEIAARLLGVSDKTVRAWVNADLLWTTQREPRVLLDPVRLHEVVHLAEDLRAAGAKNRELLEQIWYRLNDEAWLDNAGLMESLEQMARGQGRLLNANQLDRPTKDA